MQKNGLIDRFAKAKRDILGGSNPHDAIKKHNIDLDRHKKILIGLGNKKDNSKGTYYQENSVIGESLKKALLVIKRHDSGIRTNTSTDGRPAATNKMPATEKAKLGKHMADAGYGHIKFDVAHDLGTASKDHTDFEKRLSNVQEDNIKEKNLLQGVKLLAMAKKAKKAAKAGTVLKGTTTGYEKSAAAYKDVTVKTGSGVKRPNSSGATARDKKKQRMQMASTIEDGSIVEVTGKDGYPRKKYAGFDSEAIKQKFSKKKVPGYGHANKGGETKPDSTTHKAKTDKREVRGFGRDEAARQLSNFLNHPSVNPSDYGMKRKKYDHMSTYSMAKNQPDRVSSMLDKMHQRHAAVARSHNMEPISKISMDRAIDRKIRGPQISVDDTNRPKKTTKEAMNNTHNFDGSKIVKDDAPIDAYAGWISEHGMNEGWGNRGQKDIDMGALATRYKAEGEAKKAVASGHGVDKNPYGKNDPGHNHWLGAHKFYTKQAAPKAPGGKAVLVKKK